MQFPISLKWLKAAGDGGDAFVAFAYPASVIEDLTQFPLVAVVLSSIAAFSHFNEIGNCIETVTATGGGTHVLARCVLHFN